MLVINPLTGQFDETNSPEQIRTLAAEASQNFAGYSQLSPSFSFPRQKYYKIATVSFANTGMSKGARLRLTVVSINTNPYVASNVYPMAYAELDVEVSAYKEHSGLSVLVSMHDAKTFTPDDFLIALHTDGITATIYSRIPYSEQRLFYSMQYGKAGDVNVTLNNNTAGLTTGEIAAFSTNTKKPTLDGSYSVSVMNVESVPVEHKLGKIPSVVIIDENGYQVLADIQHHNTNQLNVSFVTPFTGTIYCS